MSRELLSQPNMLKLHSQFFTGQAPKGQPSAAQGGHAIHQVGYLKRLYVYNLVRVDRKFLRFIYSFKQGLEPEIAPETQNDPESEVTDDCDPFKKALDKTEVCHKNFDTDTNDQTKKGPDPEIGTENNMNQNQK